MFLADDVVIFPFKGILSIFREIHKAAIEEVAGEVREIRNELAALYQRLEQGAISDQEFDEREAPLLDRLDAIRPAAPATAPARSKCRCPTDLASTARGRAATRRFGARSATGPGSSPCPRPRPCPAPPARGARSKPRAGSPAWNATASATCRVERTTRPPRRRGHADAADDLERHHHDPPRVVVPAPLVRRPDRLRPIDPHDDRAPTASPRLGTSPRPRTDRHLKDSTTMPVNAPGVAHSVHSSTLADVLDGNISSAGSWASATESRPSSPPSSAPPWRPRPRRRPDVTSTPCPAPPGDRSESPPHAAPVRIESVHGRPRPIGGFYGWSHAGMMEEVP
jgi:hypothetical protein